MDLLNITDFIKFNDTCPICNEKLTLLLATLQPLVWQETLPRESNKISFHPKLLSKNMSDSSFVPTISIIDEQYYIDPMELSKVADFKTHNFYLFYVCNPGAVTEQFGYDFHTNPYQSCYYRSSPLITIKGSNQSSSGYCAAMDDRPEPNRQIINSDENFCVNKMTELETEKIYFFSLDYTENKSTLMHYSVSKNNREDSNFSPNIYEKILPMLNVRPNFEDKDKLIDKFENWIIMS